MKEVDLRSDTVTLPTAAMKEFMWNAPLGDDVFGEDSTVKDLEQFAAQLFGMEAALYCSSGTQTNQIAIGVHTRPGDEVICSSLAHVYLYEGGGIAQNSGCSVRLIGDTRGMFTAEEVKRNLNNTADIHLPLTRLVCIEDTVNKGGGAVWNPEEIKRISTFCRENGLRFHCDGARLFNALQVTGIPPAEYGHWFDSISICLSKGLGAPVGSLLLGSASFIALARRRRKSFGGGMRQAGIIAAGGLYALRHHLTRLSEDHEKASRFGASLRAHSFITDVMPAPTNIVIFTVRNDLSSAQVVTELAKRGLRCMPFGPDKIRCVFHLDIDETALQHAQSVVGEVARLYAKD